MRIPILDARQCEAYAQRCLDVYPQDLRDTPAWGPWRPESVPGRPKQAKVPYYASGKRVHGRQGSPEDYAELVPFDKLLPTLLTGGWGGAGFHFREPWRLGGIDADNCRNEKTGEITAWARRVSEGTLAEASPSLTGLHSMWALESPLRNGFYTLPGGGEVQVMSTRGYFTMSTLTMNGSRILPWPQELNDWVFAQAPKAPEALADGIARDIGELARLTWRLDPDCHYEIWLRVGMALHHETGGSSAGFQVWHDWSSQGLKFRSTEDLAHRWERFGSPAAGMLVTGGWLAAQSPALPVDFPTIEPSSEPTKPSAKIVTLEHPRFTPVPAPLYVKRKPPRWLIPGWLPDRGLAMLYGDAGSGKSFQALALAASIAAMRPWFGLTPSRQGAVLYIAAEGQAGIVLRLRALASAWGLDLDALPLAVIPDTPQLLNAADVKLLAEAIAAWRSPYPIALVVLDTWAAASIGGDENSGKDMGRVIQAVHRITPRDALALVVHHMGKDPDKGARGWSGLRAAVDMEIEASRSGATRRLAVTKSKDGAADDQVLDYILEPVDLGEGLSSAVPAAAQASQPAAAACNFRHAGLPQGRHQRVTLTAVRDLYALTQAPVPLETIIAAVAPHIVADPRKPDRRRDLVVRAMDSLCAGGWCASPSAFMFVPLGV